jgi:Ca2+-binding EF-hand superfamily protein
MDVNGNGKISKSEFQDTMRSLQSKAGARPLQLHVQELFTRLDTASRGYVTLDELVDNLQSDDAMLQRFRQWISAPNARHWQVVVLNEPQLRSELIQAFRLVDGKDQIKRSDFFDVLSRLRYAEWHLQDLWHRLDKDSSGELTVAEFAGFLLKDPPPKNLKLKPFCPLESLGDEERRRKVEQPRIGMSKSTKLLGAWSPDCSNAASLLKDRRKDRLFETPWEVHSVSPSGKLDLRLKRPDFVGCVKSNIKSGKSEMFHRGRHVLTVSSEPSLDLLDFAGPVGALRSFENESRSRMHD